MKAALAWRDARYDERLGGVPPASDAPKSTLN